MSSNACRTVLFPEPESPVRMTSWRESCLVCGFTGAAGSVLLAALVSAWNSHVLAVLGDGAAGDVNAGVVELLGDLLVGQRLGGVLFFDHLLDEALEGQQGHAVALRAVHRLAEKRAQLQ